MTLKFSKYQGTGNDFIMIDEKNLMGLSLDNAVISQLCDRRFGIGSDGLIVLRPRENFDFYVDYYNADGSQSFCGNGARCAVQFAKELGWIEEKCRFLAIDGEHKATITNQNEVKLLMSSVNSYNQESNAVFILDTGSPHYVKFVDQLADHDIYDEGRAIRYSDAFKANGINVNLAEFKDTCIAVKTYERGVEDETYSCGTGVTAVALSAAAQTSENEGITSIQTKGGMLKVYWRKNKSGFDEIYLEGPAQKVYEGNIEL